jgi:hypothetical protein
LAGEKVLQEGDIIVSNSPIGLSSWLTWGIDHAARCVAVHPGYVAIAEMTIWGFAIVTFASLCQHARRVVILRTQGSDRSYVLACLMLTWSFERCGYDTRFIHGNLAKSCAELVTESDDGNRLGIVPKTCWFTGRKFVTPQQILDAKVNRVWGSAL